MQAVLYHEITPESKEKVLKDGIKKGESGEKTDSEKRKVDTFLDTHLPDWAKEKQLNRAGAIYAYLTDGDRVIDIKDGATIQISDFAKRGSDVLLRLKVDKAECYVSDLDLYDTVVRALELDEQDSTREHLADRYWERIVPLADYEPGTIARPEIMVNVDIEPRNIEVAEED